MRGLTTFAVLLITAANNAYAENDSKSGLVQSVDPSKSEICLRPKNSLKSVTLQWSKSTKVLLKNGTPVTVDEIKKGDEVNVFYDSGKGIAETIYIFRVETAQASNDRQEQEKQQRLAQEKADRDRRLAQQKAEQERLEQVQRDQEKARQAAREAVARQRQEAIDRERERSGSVIFNNTTDQAIKILITEFHDETGQLRPFAHTWEFKPKERANILLDGKNVVTSRVHVKFINANGESKLWNWEKKDRGPDFVIEVHNGLLLNGSWKDCRPCAGKGTVVGDCKPCGGFGENRCLYREESKSIFGTSVWFCDGGRVKLQKGDVGLVCDQCNGRGYLKCTTCKGRGQANNSCEKCTGKGQIFTPRD